MVRLGWLDHSFPNLVHQIKLIRLSLFDQFHQLKLIRSVCLIWSTSSFQIIQIRWIKSIWTHWNSQLLRFWSIFLVRFLEFLWESPTLLPLGKNALLAIIIFSRLLKWTGLPYLREAPDSVDKMRRHNFSKMSVLNGAEHMDRIKVVVNDYSGS